jgi:cytoskeletal protein CcmA (bactofilin family)
MKLKPFQNTRKLACVGASLSGLRIFNLLKESFGMGSAGGEITMTDIHNDILEDDDFDTILSRDIDFSGALTFDKSFLIRGKFSGTIEAGGLLMIDEGALVDAVISVSQVIIRGTVKGDIYAKEKVEIAATGRLTGNVSAPEGSFIMEHGCMFNGNCIMADGGGRNS